MFYGINNVLSYNLMIIMEKILMEASNEIVSKRGVGDIMLMVNLN